MADLRPAIWLPRHRGRKLAHHLVPAFVVASFLLALAVAALLMDHLLFAVSMLALGAAAAVSILREFRRHGSVPTPESASVVTSSGRRAATRFAMAGATAVGSAVTVGLGVVTMVAALALEARYLLLHGDQPRLLQMLGSAVLLVVGFGILREGLRLARVAATDHPPGVYLTRSRIVVSGPDGMNEVYWKDVESVAAENPRGRVPLGDRGPAYITVRRRSGGDGLDSRRAARRDFLQERRHKRVVVPVQYLTADPNLLLNAVEHYLTHPDDRPELGTPAALRRLAGHG
ncbi:hypothetical protein GCM10023081_17900 [Arthrobacter ginkgonis]|uniref:Uncharacterized protein n=1 Tax=Arthrobacter ginkgonis TaxID=1630594 RepID=A0ABP7C503_9MICC